MNNVLLATLIACSALAVGVQGILYQSPVSTAVVTSNDVVLLCTGNEDSETVHPYTWQYNPLSDEPIVIVYDCQVNPAYANLYTAEVNADGGCDLRIRSVTPNSAGTYTCQHWFDQGSAVLVVLNSNSSNCNFGPTDLIGGDTIDIQCFLNYNGSIAPRMDFRAENGMVYTNATINTFPTQVNGRVRFPVYPPTTRAVTANTYFMQPITFEFIWYLPTLLIQFPPTNIAVEVQSDYECANYADFTRLKCTADGFPQPDFTWTDVSTGEVFATDVVTLTKKGENNFVCTARNTIRGQQFTTQRQISVTISEDEPTPCEPPTTESTTTTTEEPTTTTTQPIPITECGSVLQVSPPEAPIVSGWGPSCFISRENDTDYLDTPCRELIQRLPPDIGDYTELLRRGGNFGCTYSTRQDFVGTDNACFNNYQQMLVLSAVPTATKLIVCIRLPPTGK